MSRPENDGSPVRGRVPADVRPEVEVLWAYHDLGHAAAPADVGIGLGSHDLGVADHAARLFHAGLVPLVLFTGANAPTTLARFPRGEAVHYRERALALGVPDDAVLVEPRARNTGENLTFSRDLLRERGVEVRRATLVCRPYQQRRAYATARRVWPELEVACSSAALDLDTYVAGIGDADRVISMLVGDTQRIELYAQRGFAVPQPVPDDVRAAYERLVAAGYTSRLLPT